MVHTADALIVQDWRGRHCENVHVVDVAVVSNTGASVAEWGDASREVIPRSAIKSAQALPLVMSGAADAFAVSDDELALACASHGGEPLHVDSVHSWLVRIGLGTSDLECGPSDPIDHDAMAAVYRRGEIPNQLHNCCSGKHTGFLSTCRHLGIDHRGYIRPEHPVQDRVTQAQAVMTGVDLRSGPVGIDGCGIPVFVFPLRSLALAMARLVRPAGIPDEYAAAATRVSRALVDRPWLVSGTGRAVTSFTDAANEPLVIKSGAAGVFMAGFPERGIGLAVKANSGEHRAAEAAADWVLRSLGAYSEPAVDLTIYNRAEVAAGKTIVIGR